VSTKPGALQFTFWGGFWTVVAWVQAAPQLFITMTGIPIALFPLVMLGAWVVYRVARGWLALNERRPMPD